MLTIPKILDTPEFYDAPLDYKWNGIDSATYYAVDAESNKIGLAFFALNHKSTYGLASALFEWIYWRMSRHISLDIDSLSLVTSLLESHWAATVDKRYSYFWEFEILDVIRTETNPTNQVIWTMLKITNTPRQTYHQGRYLINAKMDKLVILARHISPDKKMFDKWFNGIFKKATKLFPAQYDRVEIIENRNKYMGTTYDSSDEPAIPREFFFDEDYDYKTADNVKLINDFLSSVDYQNNKTLNNPDKMLAEGFEGTPYKYEPK